MIYNWKGRQRPYEVRVHLKSGYRQCFVVVAPSREAAAFMAHGQLMKRYYSKRQTIVQIQVYNKHEDDSSTVHNPLENSTEDLNDN